MFEKALLVFITFTLKIGFVQPCDFLLREKAYKHHHKKSPTNGLIIAKIERNICQAELKPKLLSLLSKEMFLFNIFFK